MNPSTRLKVRGDTFFVHGTDGSVYFRNNIGSFRMEGGSINQWIEKLLPVFNGEHSMQDLTDGLPEPYQKRVYEIAEVLQTNGYVRDVSGDLPHQLSESVQEKYAAQIEFLDSFEGSGGHRFQRFRESTVLAAGSGSFFVSLVKALLEAGLPRIQLLITDSQTTSRDRIVKLAEEALQSDQQVKVDEISLPKEGRVNWNETIRPFDAVFFVSSKLEETELIALNRACREENKILLPAVILEQAGVAGPLVHPGSDICWESAWRRIHHLAISHDPEVHSVSSTAEALLANVVVFEWLKTSAGVTPVERNNKLYLLNLETLEGGWHPFLTHPLTKCLLPITEIEDIEIMIESEAEGSAANHKSLVPYFSSLTSAETGIFQWWEEGELLQLPLSQCRVQAVDPLSIGPNGLLPSAIYSGFTHEDARTEAGFAGIEAYVSRLSEQVLSDQDLGGVTASGQGQTAYVGVGAGRTATEGISRGLQKCLNEELVNQLKTQTISVTIAKLGQIDDEPTRFYLTSLNALEAAPLIGFGDAVLSFPVAWIGIQGRWYGAVDLNRTTALRRALQQVLQLIQNKEESEFDKGICQTQVQRKEAENIVHDFPKESSASQRDRLIAALNQLKLENKRVITYDLAVEAFLKEELAGVFGVSLREEVDI